MAKTSMAEAPPVSETTTAQRDEFEDFDPENLTPKQLENLLARANIDDRLAKKQAHNQKSNPEKNDDPVTEQDLARFNLKDLEPAEQQKEINKAIFRLIALFQWDEEKPDKILHSYDKLKSKWRSAWFTNVYLYLQSMAFEGFITDENLKKRIETELDTIQLLRKENYLAYKSEIDSTEAKPQPDVPDKDKLKYLTSEREIEMANQTILDVITHLKAKLDRAQSNTA